MRPLPWLLAAVLLVTAAAGAIVARRPVTPKFVEMPREMQVQLDRQRQFAAALVEKHFPGQALSRSPADFALLQRILDANLIPREQTWQLQSLGVVFGDALAAKVPGLRWWQVTDEFGTDPALRFEGTTLQVNALTTISKRVERGEAVDVESMAQQFADFVAEHKHEFQ